MTKSVVVTLVLVVLAFGIMRGWFFDQPSTDPVDIGKVNEQTQGATEDSSSSSRSKEPYEASSLAINISSGSPVKSSSESSLPTASASRTIRSTRTKRQDSTFPDDEQAEGLAISGLVQDEEGYPLANVKVLAEPISLSDADKMMRDPSLEAVLSARTGYDGSFLFGNLTDDEYWIRVAPIDGFASAETTARAGEKSANLMLVLLRNIRVFGIVSSTEGAPLEDVLIIAGPPTSITETGPKGHYDLDIRVKGKHRHSIRFQRDGYRDQSVQLEAADLDGLFDDFLLDVSMEPHADLTTVAGRLEDPDGRPVAGKVLILRSSRLNTSYDVRSDLGGRFVMEGVEPGNDYRLSVRPGADYKNFESTRLDIPSKGLKLNIVLEPLYQGELSGWMTDLDGVRIPGMKLTLQSKVAAGQSVQVVSDNTGYFEVEKFPEGGAVLKTNSYPIFETRGIGASYAAEEPFSVILDVGPHELYGQVMNVFGETVAAPVVSLGWQYNQNGVQNNSARKTTANQNGNFAFSGLGPGVHTLRVYAPGYSAAELKIDVGMDPGSIIVELEEES